MRSIVHWAVHNSPSMNTLMVAVLTVGLGSLALLRRETFPRFELDIVLATVIYPGASPSEIEEGICQKIEEAVRAIDGIKKITSIADEGRGFVVCELESNVRDPQRVLNEIRSEIDRIPSFPLDAEDPQVQQIVIRNPAIRVSVVGGPDIPEGGGNLRAERQLRDLAEQVRDELLLLPSVSQVTIVAERPYQIDVEIPEATLRKYGLSLSDVAQAIRNENIEQPAGTIRTESHEFLVRGQNKYLLGQEIAALPALKSGGNTILVGELGYVRDGFEDTVVYNRINGRPALTMQVEKTADEDLLQIVAEVRQYSEEKQHQLPQGYELVVWSDGSQDVRDRLELLTRTGLSGLVLVFVVLSIFLEIRLAFWVALGIPVSVLGACAVMLAIDSTLNMLTMFAFVMGLGIVVDDAIVIGENIYKHRQLGKNAFRAAIDGTVEVAPSVMASVATTIIAFVPLAMVSGVMGKFIGVMPPVIIAMLVISLVESLIILPCHLAHSRGETEGWNRRFRRRVEGGVEAVVQRVYLPSLRWSLDHPAAVYSGAIMSFLLTLGLIRGGFAPFILFPRVDGNVLRAQIVFPDGTPAITTAESTKILETGIQQIANEIEAAADPPLQQPLIRVLSRSVGKVSQMDPSKNVPEGSNVGEVMVELIPVEQRGQISSQEILNRWRDATPEFPGVEELTFTQMQIAPAAKAIEFKLLGPDLQRVAEAAAAVKERLATVAGVYDITDDSRPGKWELRLRVRPDAEALGVNNADVVRTVRATYLGEEVMRLQRGRHEVKLMVRYPPEERRTMAAFGDVRVRAAAGEIPLPDLVEVDYDRAYSEINRVDQRRSITVSADVNEDIANGNQIVDELQVTVLPEILANYPEIRVRWEGEREQRNESMRSLYIGFLVALFSMFLLLTVEFRSYVLPLIILSILPFGIVGAVLGHLVMAIPITLFSMFGLVALAGVLCNDSIVLIDFINHRVHQTDLNLRESLLDAGRQRFRPVMLTSMTTIAGLLPLLLERSLQAQVLIPMAVSLSFGLFVATVWVLVLVPTLYQTLSRWRRLEELAVD